MAWGLDERELELRVLGERESYRRGLVSTWSREFVIREARDDGVGRIATQSADA